MDLEEDQVMAGAEDIESTIDFDYPGAADPIWVDRVWLDTVVVVGLTCFILCLMGLSKVCPNCCVIAYLCCAAVCRSRRLETMECPVLQSSLACLAHCLVLPALTKENTISLILFPLLIIIFNSFL